MKKQTTIDEARRGSDADLVHAMAECLDDMRVLADLTSTACREPESLDSDTIFRATWKIAGQAEEATALLRDWQAASLLSKHQRDGMVELVLSTADPEESLWGFRDRSERPSAWFLDDGSRVQELTDEEADEWVKRNKGKAFPPLHAGAGARRNAPRGWST